MWGWVDMVQPRILTIALYREANPRIACTVKDRHTSDGGIRIDTHPGTAWPGKDKGANVSWPEVGASRVRGQLWSGIGRERMARRWDSDRVPDDRMYAVVLSHEAWLSGA